MTAVIRLEDIMKTYVMGDAVVHALDHVSVEIGVGEFTSIMGPSGSGKSTMMNILGCLDRPTSGQYYLDGKEVAGYSDDELARTRNAKIGFVFQNFNLLPKLSAQLNVALPLVYAGIGEEERLERAKTALEAVGLGDRGLNLFVFVPDLAALQLIRGCKPAVNSKSPFRCAGSFPQILD